MKDCLTIEEAGGITSIQFLKKPTYLECLEAVDYVAANCNYKKKLWDFSVSNFDFSRDEIVSIADYGKRTFTEANVMAIVAPTDLAFGQSRQFAVHRDEERHSHARVFRTKPEALAWLQSQPCFSAWCITRPDAPTLAHFDTRMRS